MKALTRTEAQRVLNILESANDRLEILAHLPLAYNETFSLDLENSEPLPFLEKLWKCEESLGKIQSTSGLFDSKDITLLRNTHKYVRAVSRNAVEHRETLIQKPIAVSNEFCDLLKYLKELQNLTFSSLNTTVEDEETNRNALHELGDKTRLLEETKRILDSKLLEMQFQRERQVQDLDDATQKLELELKELSQSNSADCAKFHQEMTDAVTKATADHQQRMTQLKDQLKVLEASSRELADRNLEDELRYRKDKNRAEAALNERISEYNTVMEARRKQLSEIEAAYSLDNAAYLELKGHFDKVDAALAIQEEEERILLSICNLEERGMKGINDAATRIQSLFSGSKSTCTLY